MCVCYTFFYCWNSAVGVKRQCDCVSLCATAGLFEDAGPEVTLLKQLCKVFFIILDQQWRYYCSLELMLTTVSSKEMNINDLMTPVFLLFITCKVFNWKIMSMLHICLFILNWKMCSLCSCFSHTVISMYHLSNTYFDWIVLAVYFVAVVVITCGDWQLAIMDTVSWGWNHVD